MSDKIKRKIKFVIYGELPSLNSVLKQKSQVKFTLPDGRKIYKYTDTKGEQNTAIHWEIKSQLKGVEPISGNCAIILKWYRKARTNDPDNIASAIKFILDGAQESGLLPGDGWKNMSGGILHLFAIDKANPRVEVTILENQSLSYGG